MIIRALTRTLLPRSQAHSAAAPCLQRYLMSSAPDASTSPRPSKIRRLSQTLSPVQMPSAVEVAQPAAAVGAKANLMTSSSAPAAAPGAQEPALLVLRDKEHPNAKLPTRGSALAAGYDLYASEQKIIPARGRAVVQTGIRLAIPEGCYGRVAPRSGLASKHGIDVGAGVVDADYRGLLGVLLFNFTDEDFSVNVGDRIAQLVLERICLAEVQEVESLEETVRGAGGFGSTGGFGPGQKA